MLQIRPNCELCNRALAPDSTAARICSYECTFCSDCVREVLENVCPNCGGGFARRPIRPVRERRNGVCLGRQPASTETVRSAYSEAEIRAFASGVKDIPAEQR
jgi:uncharacterized protein